MSITGGAGGASIYWTNASGTNVGSSYTVTGLPAGTYTYHYSDASATFTGTVVVTQPGGPLAVALNTVNTTCSYLNNGSAVASITANGTPNFSYSWSAAGQTNSPTATNLSPGPITVTVTDANSCTATASGTVSGHTLLTASVTTLPDSCYQANKGIATVTAGGGTPNYTYQWNNGPTSVGSSIYNIGTGTYVVTVTDQNGCTATSSGFVNQPALLTGTISDSNIACFGGNNGSITVAPTGGNGGNTFAWTSSVSTTATATGLSAGTYYVTVTDVNHCFFVDSAILTQPSTAVADSVLTLDSVSCNGGNNGGVSIAGYGGSAPYTFSIDGGAYQSSGTFSGLSAGSHTVSVKDAHLCTNSVTFSIYQPTLLVPSITYVREVSCAGSCNGTIAANATGGTPPYTFSDDGITYTTVDSFTSLCAGHYTISVKDALGCIKTITDSVTQPDSLKLTVTALTEPLCFGGSNGQIAVSAAGGTPLYLYSIDLGTPQLTGSFSGLSTGLHIIGVGDTHLCLDTIHVQLDQPALLVVDTISTTNISCFGSNDGTVTLGVSGGTYPYTYSWPQAAGVTDSLGIHLPAGSDTAYVTDAHGCRDTISATLTQPAVLAPFIVALDSVSCYQGANGGVTISATGGTAPYTYALDTATTFVSSGVFTGLDSGVHTVTVKDAHLCDSTITFSIFQPTLLIPSITYTINASCNGSCNGSIAMSATGGTPPYTFSKDGVNYQAADSFTSLCAGYDTLWVKDARGCAQSVIDSITQPAVLTLAVSDTIDPLCHGGNDGHIAVTAAGGTQAYSYTIDGGTAQAIDSFTAVTGGTHVIVVTDAQGCNATVSVALAQPSAVVSAPTLTNVSCYDSADGSVTLSTTGGFGPYTYSWPQVSGNTSNTASGLSAGVYATVITDAHGCSQTISDTVTQPAQPTLEILPADTTLTYGDTISLHSAFGPASLGAPTAYLWADTNAALSCTTCPAPILASNDSFSTYTLQVTYLNGCKVSASTSVKVNQLDTFAVADAFSPNGDGKNDTYFIQAKEVKSFHMDIYDRWGQSVFTSDDITVGWDGTFKGVQQPVGVYTIFFTLEYGKKTVSRTASITLLR